MVKYVGYVSEDTRDLSEIGLFQNFKKNLKRKAFDEGKDFTATSGDIKMHADGKAMLFVLKKPAGGTMNKVQVKVDGDKQYDLSGLSIKLRKFKDFFKGNYEKKIFSGNDKQIGSNQADKLYAFDGNDTVKAGNGGDTLVGSNGNDQLYGESGGDSLSGGKGNDLLDGGSGQNTLTGGPGDDSFRFSAQLNNSNFSTITDFTKGQDSIELVNSAFPGIGSKGKLNKSKFILAEDYNNESGVVVYTKATGLLSFAVSAGNVIDFGDVTDNLNLKNGDIFVV